MREYNWKNAGHMLQAAKEMAQVNKNNQSCVPTGKPKF